MEDEFLQFLHLNKDQCFNHIQATNPSFDDLANHLVAFVNVNNDLQGLSSNLKQWIDDKGFQSAETNFRPLGLQRIWQSNAKNTSLQNRHLFKFLHHLRYTKHNPYGKLYKEDFAKFLDYIEENPEYKHIFQQTVHQRLQNEHPELYADMLNDFMKDHDISLNSFKYLSPEEGKTTEEKNFATLIHRYDSLYK
jgi:hypothetical protein